MGKHMIPDQYMTLYIPDFCGRIVLEIFNETKQYRVSTYSNQLFWRSHYFKIGKTSVAFMHGICSLLVSGKKLSFMLVYNQEKLAEVPLYSCKMNDGEFQIVFKYNRDRGLFMSFTASCDRAMAMSTFKRVESVLLEEMCSHSCFLSPDDWVPTYNTRLTNKFESIQDFLDYQPHFLREEVVGDIISANRTAIPMRRLQRMSVMNFIYSGIVRMGLGSFTPAPGFKFISPEHPFMVLHATDIYIKGHCPTPSIDLYTLERKHEFEVGVWSIPYKLNPDILTIPNVPGWLDVNRSLFKNVRMLIDGRLFIEYS